MKRERCAKGAVDGLEHRRMVVTGYVFADRPLVELRTLLPGRQPVTFDQTIPQARETVRLLQAAIEAAEAQARRDGSDVTPAGRAPAGEGPDYAGDHRGQS